MKSSELKMVALTWLRYYKQMSYVATEAGPWRADVFGANEKKSIELEVKVDAADLEHEFVKTKHAYYAHPSGKRHVWVPTYFYFMVPENLRDRAVTLVEQKAHWYGVLSVRQDPSGSFCEVPYRRVSVYRRPKILVAGDPHKELFAELTHRMASEICGFHMLRDVYGRAFDDVRGLIQRTAAAPVPANTCEEDEPCPT